MSRIEEIRSNAIELIALHGFGSVSLRQLAKSCGLQAGSLYVYYRNKEDLLLDLIAGYLEDLQQSWQERAYGTDDAIHRLMGFISHHLEFQSERRAESLIASLDLRSLPEDSRREVIRMKTGYEQELKGILDDGARQGLFNQDRMASTAILSMLTGLCIWQEHGESDTRQLFKLCQRTALQIVGASRSQGVISVQLPVFS